MRTELNVSGDQPSPRDSAAMAPLEGKVVLFGGYDGNGNYLGDTWVFDGQSWTHVSDSGPSPRASANIAAVNNELVLFGGADDDQCFADTWVWNGSAWTKWGGAPPSSTPCEYGGAATALGNDLVVFGGLYGTTTTNLLDTTLLWSSSGWTQWGGSTGPDARSFATMAASGNQGVLFGGIGTVDEFSDTWLWSGSVWTSPNFLGPQPEPRDSAGMAALEGNVILFGGETGDQPEVFLGDTWTWSGAGWTPINVDGPVASAGMAMATFVPK